MPRQPPSPSTDRDGFRFRGGHVALDLTATLAGRAKAQPRELLDESVDLLRWLDSAGLPAREATGADLQQARQLREAIYALVLARIAGTEAATAREAINRIAAEPPALPQLQSDGSILLSGSAGAMLSMIAREAIGLFGGSQAGQVRQCEAGGCSLVFVDSSRRRDRRWCSMTGCGNRAKLSEFRRRQREKQVSAR